jgi:hypothetical protein
VAKLANAGRSAPAREPMQVHKPAAVVPSLVRREPRDEHQAEDDAGGNRNPYGCAVVIVTVRFSAATAAATSASSFCASYTMPSLMVYLTPPTFS